MLLENQRGRPTEMRRVDGSDGDDLYSIYRVKLQDLFTAFSEWRVSHNQRYLGQARAIAKEIDEMMNSPNIKTVQLPLGIFHSAGLGFHAQPRGSIDRVRKRFPLAQAYGYTKLSPQTAEFSAKAYEHLQQLAIRADRFDPTGNLALDELLELAYIPTPNPLTSLNLPAVGPVNLTDDEAMLFIGWVLGPVLHDQLNADKAQTDLPEEISGLHHYEMFVVSHATGVWQAYPYTPRNSSRMASLESRVRTYYTRLGRASISSYASFVGLPVDDNLKKALLAIDAITSSLVVDTDPLNGNVGRYFDSALRNFIAEVGNEKATSADVLYRVSGSGGDIDYYTLFNTLRRVDFSNSRRLWGLYEEDIAHITENWNVADLPHLAANKQVYDAAVTLTRLALAHHEAYEVGGDKKNLTTAIEAAEQLESLRSRKSTAMDSPLFVSYTKGHEPTSTIMPWLRKLRQGVLALVYVAKLTAHEAQTGVPINQTIRRNRISEAQHYVSACLTELPAVIDAAGLDDKVLGEGVSALTEMLQITGEHISKREFDTDYLLNVGATYLNMLQ